MTKPQQDASRVFPWAAVTACLSFLIGSGLVVAAVRMLAGDGWALLTAAVPFVLLALVIARGMAR